MLFWGLVEVELQEAIELYVRRADADDALAHVLNDEPSWLGLVTVQPIEFADLSSN